MKFDSLNALSNEILRAYAQLLSEQLAEAKANADAATLIIFDALRTETAIKFLYADQDGVLSVRQAVPTAIRKCKNGRVVVVEAYDLNRQAVRNFHMGTITLIG